MKNQDKNAEITLHKTIPLEQAVENEKALVKKFKRFNYYFNIFINKLHPKKTDSILDACCGGGYLTYLIYSKGFRNITGFDISPFSINVAKKAFPDIAFFVSDAESISLPSKSQDIIFISNALHHFPDLKKVSSEFSRILKSKGRVFAIEPNIFNPINILREIIGKLKNEKTENEFPLSPFRVKKEFSKDFKVKLSYARFFTKLIVVMEKH